MTFRIIGPHGDVIRASGQAADPEAPNRSRRIIDHHLLPRRVMTGEGQIARLTALVMGEVRHEIDEAVRRSYR